VSRSSVDGLGHVFQNQVKEHLVLLQKLTMDY
jgi:hypothetical protein